MLKDGTEAFQRIRAVRGLDIHLILSLLFSNEGSEAPGGEEVCLSHTDGSGIPAV